MTAPAVRPDDDIAALAKGGRTNFFGFVIRLLARIPFLFIAGQLYGPSLLGRFAYAVIVVELAAQLATLGLKRGLAQQLSTTDRPVTRDIAAAASESPFCFISWAPRLSVMTGAAFRSLN